MSHADHEWTRDHLAAHAADGLPADERARLAAHLETCAPCRGELDEIRGLDRSMGALFAPVRSSAGLEDRVIKSLRTRPAKRSFQGRGWRILSVAAALLLVGLTGALIVQIEGVVTTDVVAVQDARMTVTPESEWSGYNAMPSIGGVHHYAPTDLRVDGAYGERRGGKDGLSSSSVVSVDELAQKNANGMLKSLEEGKESAQGKWKYWGDRNETADGEVFGNAKGDASVVTKKPVDNLSVSGFAAEGGRTALRRSRLDYRKMPATGKVVMPGADYYRFESNAPASAPAKDPGYFQPGRASQTAAVLSEVRALNKNLKDLQAGPKEKVTEQLEKLEEAQKDQDAAKPKPRQARKIIRSGRIEFEIEAFDSTVARITSIAGEEGGFVATINSQKLPNGKVRGTVVVRIPPDRLDTLILKLRALGELKSQQIGSQDVTKAYFDIESRLRAARTMEERLLKIIKEGKGAIKDLLMAEKELGQWRTKIETLEGEIRYYNNLISLSTLTITLYEKEIRSPFAITETERVEMGLEVEDVEKSHREALTLVADAKGRVTKSELKQLAAGQFHALLQFEVAPDEAGPLRDRLKQLGTVARLDVNRMQKTEGGDGKPGAVEIKRADTQFSVSVYNLANIAPRETVHLRLAAQDPEAAFKAILARIEEAGGRVVSSNLNRQKSEKTTGTIKFEVKSDEADAVLIDVRAEGEVMNLQVTENPDAQNVTRSKRGFNCELFAMGMVEPLETTTMQLAAGDVPKAFAALLEAARTAGARILVSQLNEGNGAHVSGTLQIEVRRESETAVRAAIEAAGTVASRSVRRASNPQNAVDSKTRLDLTLVEMASLAPTVTTTIRLAAKDVPAAHRALTEAVAKANGWILNSQLNEQDRHNVSATLMFDVLQEKDGEIATALETAGDILTRTASRPQNAVRSPVAKSRVQLTLINLAQVAPRENYTLGVEVANVDKAVEAVKALAAGAKGTADARISKQRTGQDVASVTVTVPLAAGAELAGKIKDMGHVRVIESFKNPQVPDSRLAVARLNVTLSNELIVPSDSGPWQRIKKGFSLSLQAGSWALMFLMIGLFFIVPLALTCWGGWKVYRKVNPRRTPTID